ncbi:MAG TPA: hypothetical protein PKV91_08350 [Bacillota bacterium]|jgi:hypothetical protein|nr:hypothetical protein [Bacillota bacterium]HOA36357.1 hypothetical protein [Bacillota bacterium]HOJ83526.1 hypothetical protein [Bacillota bacterium]HOL14810.1 hypothetical protein [Bacillota bacterium]HPZ12348.1 hypothetical protein [Bacillota bacterium]
MEEKAVDFDSLSGLIRSTLKRMDRDELSGIFYLMETGKLQQIMLELLGIDGLEYNRSELVSIMTAMLQAALHDIMKNNGV